MKIFNVKQTNQLFLIYYDFILWNFKTLYHQLILSKNPQVFFLWVEGEVRKRTCLKKQAWKDETVFDTRAEVLGDNRQGRMYNGVIKGLEDFPGGKNWNESWWLGKERYKLCEASGLNTGRVNVQGEGHWRCEACRMNFTSSHFKNPWVSHSDSLYSQ